VVFGALRETFSRLEWLDLEAPLAGGFLRGRNAVHIRFKRR
jgi:hypothetical protein